MSVLTPGEVTVLKVSSAFSIKVRVLRENLGDLVSARNRSALECSVDTAWHFGEFGVYDLVVQPGECSTDTHLNPVNIYLRKSFKRLIFLTNKKFQNSLAFSDSNCSFLLIHLLFPQWH